MLTIGVHTILKKKFCVSNHAKAISVLLGKRDLYFCYWPNPVVGKLFTRRARFGKTAKAAGRTLIGKQEEDFFLEIKVHVRM